METVDALCARLRMLPRVRWVEVSRYPLDLRPDANVVGSTTPHGEQADGSFMLRIVTGAAHAKE